MVKIREYSERDRNEVVRLTEESQEYYEPLDELKRVQYKKKSAEFFVQLMFDKAQKEGMVYVAEENDIVVGFISGHISEIDEEEQKETINKKPGVVDEFFITESYRKKGIGTKLFIKMEEYFRAKDCDIVRLYVFAPNAPARDFYKGKGYSDRLVTVLKVP